MVVVLKVSSAVSLVFKVGGVNVRLGSKLSGTKRTPVGPPNPFRFASGFGGHYGVLKTSLGPLPLNKPFLPTILSGCDR